MAPGRLLVLFDDVWHPAPLRFLNRALPADVVRLVTTRSANVAQTVGGKMVTLDLLIPPDGLALLEDRLNCQNDVTSRPPLEALVKLLDGHALALDIAAARMKKPTRAAAILHELQQGLGKGELGSLNLPPSEERDENLETSLGFSYEQMNREQQRRFRALGVFASEAPIRVEAAAAVWGIKNRDTAENALFDLVDLAFLTEVEDLTGRSYRQHGVLRVYAYALLNKAYELTRTSTAHAQYYTDMSWHAVTAIPPEYPLLDQHIQNLLTALQWTADGDPSLFLRLLEPVSHFLLLRGQSVLLERYLPKAVKAAATTDNKVRQANLLRSLGDLESSFL